MGLRIQQLHGASYHHLVDLWVHLGELVGLKRVAQIEFRQAVLQARQAVVRCRVKRLNGVWAFALRPNLHRLLVGKGF